MSKQRGESPRSGFSLIEVIVALAIMIMMAAVILPSVIRAVDKARVDDGISELTKIRDGVAAFESDVNEYPSRITHLTTDLVNGSEDICGNNYSNGERGDWDGPYFDRVVPATGLPISIGLAQDFFPRTGTLLTIVVTNVSMSDAIEIDAAMDDGVATTNGIRWTGTDPVTLSYLLNSGC